MFDPGRSGSFLRRHVPKRCVNSPTSSCRDPAIDSVTAFAGRRQRWQHRAHVRPAQAAQRTQTQLRSGSSAASLEGRQDSGRRSLSAIRPGSQRRCRFGGAQYQYTLQARQSRRPHPLGPHHHAAPAKNPELRDINSDQQMHGLQSSVVIDRDTAAVLASLFRTLTTLSAMPSDSAQVSTSTKA